MQIHGGSRVNDRITDRLVPRTDDLVSLVSRDPERAAYVAKVCIDAINARVKPVSRSSAILRYATFFGTPQRTSLHTIPLSTAIPHKTLPRLRPFLAVVGN